MRWSTALLIALAAIPSSVSAQRLSGKEKTGGPTPFGTASQTTGASPARPNIVLLVTDDQRSDCLGCMGHPFLKTPNIIPLLQAISG